MRVFGVVLLLLAGATAALRAQEFLDRLQERLTLSAFDDNLRVRLSGTLDLEYYHFDQPAPGLIDASGHDLFNPRLTTFLDAQIGPSLYFFAQARFDRHFDPSDRGAQVRLDEYALRFTPWQEGQLSIQAGKFASVVGSWNPRHLSWDNPFITAPLFYENVTILEDMRVLPLPYINRGILEDDKYEYLPIMWGPSYASGISASGKVGKFEAAIEVKNASLSSRPESWDLTQIGFQHPTVSGRAAVRPNEMWNFGFSASKGPYFRPEAEPTLSESKDLYNYEQLVLGQDVSFAWRHLQIWAEFYESRFEVPTYGTGPEFNADAFSYYIEAKYKFLPQLSGALRWNQQFFSDAPSAFGGSGIPWWHDIWRVDTALIYRLTEHIQLKVQYDLQNEDGPGRGYGHTFATQITVRF